MKSAYVVVGLGFGDEAKGATVDFMTRILNVSLNVRFSGGPQAAHHVVLPDGTMHCFSQFGSGTFAGASTYLSKHMRVAPLNMLLEADNLMRLGAPDPIARTYVHQDCLVVTPSHARRSKANATVHNRGTCGTGSGEAYRDSLTHPKRAIYVRDFDDLWTLNYKLRMQNLDTKYTSILHQFGKRINIVRDDSILNNHDVVIFEGTQGYGLDETLGTLPYVTSTITTAIHGSMMCWIRNIRPTVIGCTRIYLTRHGVGPMLTENELFNSTIHELHNIADDLRGPMRYGDLNMDMMKKAIAASSVDYLAVSHLDQVDLVKGAYWVNGENRLRSLIEEFTNKKIGITGHGMSWIDRKWLI